MVLHPWQHILISEMGILTPLSCPPLYLLLFYEAAVSCKLPGSLKRALSFLYHWIFPSSTCAQRDINYSKAETDSLYEIQLEPTASNSHPIWPREEWSMIDRVSAMTYKVTRVWQHWAERGHRAKTVNNKGMAAQPNTEDLWQRSLVEKQSPPGEHPRLDWITFPCIW